MLTESKILIWEDLWRDFVWYVSRWDTGNDANSKDDDI